MAPYVFVMPFIITFVVFILLFGGHGFDMNYVTAQLCGGGLMLGAFFMATDYTTTPTSPVGQFIFGIGCGVLTFVIRKFGGYPEGVSFSILLMNLATPLIDRYIIPRKFGEVSKHGGK